MIFLCLRMLEILASVEGRSAAMDLVGRFSIDHVLTRSESAVYDEKISYCFHFLRSSVCFGRSADCSVVKPKDPVIREHPNDTYISQLDCPWQAKALKAAGTR